MDPLPRQRHGLKMRQRGCVVERRGIPCEQQVDALDPADPAGRREQLGTVCAGTLSRVTVTDTPRLPAVVTIRCNPAGSRSERPRRTGDRLGDGEIRMSQRERRVRADDCAT